MEKEIFKQFEKQFGEEWVCNCGNPFKAEWVETISQGKNSFLAKYHCRVCGQEQIFAASSEYSAELVQTPVVEIPSTALTSDDVLDITEEASKVTSGQIKSLGRKRSGSKVSVPKYNHK